MFKTIKSKFRKLTHVFSKLRISIGGKIKNLLQKRDESSFEDLEKLFFESDLGAAFSMELVDTVKKLIRKNPSISTDEILKEIKKELLSIVNNQKKEATELSHPHVILIVGTNGSGKTTSIAKLAKHYKAQGKKILISASDTFRAAAIDQIETWAKRVGSEIVTAKPGSDPSAVVFDAISAGIARGSDVIIIDTAGRLHTKTDLMSELEKIQRVIKKKLPDAPHETLLVLDATIGQNALDQVEIFNRYTPITGIILTKLDGSAKGGIVLAIKQQKNLDVQWVGLGETEEDLVPFDSEAFIEALLKNH